MGWVRLKIELPCGLKYESELKGWGAPEVIGYQCICCPLHGKSCNKNK